MTAVFAMCYLMACFGAARRAWQICIKDGWKYAAVMSILAAWAWPIDIGGMVITWSFEAEE